MRKSTKDSYAIIEMLVNVIECLQLSAQKASWMRRLGDRILQAPDDCSER